MYDSLLFPTDILFNILPYAILCYFPFMDRLKTSKKNLILLLLSISCAQFAFYYLFSDMPYWLVIATFLVWLIIYLHIYLFTIKMSVPKLIFIFLLITHYAGVVAGISNALEMCFSPDVTRYNRYSIIGILIHMGVLLATLPPIMLLYRKITTLLIRKDAKAWNRLWIIPLTYVLTLIVFVNANKDTFLNNIRYILIISAMTVSAAITYYIIIRMLIETDENATLRENVRMIDMQLAHQKEAYEGLSSRIAQAREARHDLRHHLSVIESYLQSGDRDRLLDYLKEYRSSLPDDPELILCENSAANMVALYYTGLAKKEGISVSAGLQIPQKVGIADSDLCIILGNCLENALEACRRMDKGQKYIHMKSKIRGDILGIAVDNSFDGKIYEKEGHFLSRKRSHEEGIGLSSVRAVAEKYRGTALFSFNENEFQASVVVNLRT